MRRRLVAIAAFLTPLGAWMACTFPEVTFESGEAEAGTTEGGGVVTLEEGGIVASDGAILADVIVRDDATARVDPDACAPDDCDCDKDGYPRADCDAGTDAATAIDCDDLDPLRHPNQGWVDEETDDPDWNCDGKLEYEPKRNPSCSGTGALLGCRGGHGFIAEVKCGTEGDIYECRSDALLGGCALKPNGVRVKQLCK